MKRIDYTPGDVIGLCVYVCDVYTPVGKMRMARFKCSCGTEFKAKIALVKNGSIKSCGCYKKKLDRERFLKHGMKNHKLYPVWSSIKNRCYNKNDSYFEDYGGRGINMYDEWRNNFKFFYDYIINLPNAEKPGYSVDREDNDGNYEPGNMKWSTRHEQASNKKVRRNNKTGYTGVVKRGDKFIAQIRIHSKDIRIGRYNTATQAVMARDNYIIENELWEYPLQILTDPRT